MDGLELRDYLTPLRRWWWLLLSATIIAAAASYSYTSLQPMVYRSSTTLMVGGALINDPNLNASQIYQAQQLAESYANIAQRGLVTNGVREALGLSYLPEFFVWPQPNTPFVNIAVQDTDPVRAQAVAKEFVAQLIQQSPAGREQNRQGFIHEQLDEVEVNIETTKETIAQKEQEYQVELSASNLDRLQQDITKLQDKLANLRETYAALLAQTQTGSLNSIEVIEEAYLPTSPIDSNALQYALLAGMVGLVLAAAGVFILEYLDDTVKSSEQIEKLTGLATLGVVPFIPSNEAGNELGPLVMLENEQAPSAEAYRILRTNLQFASVDNTLKLLMVTSPSPKEGKSITTANLSAALAHAGKRVILVDADLHRPRQHQLFQLINNVGLTTALLHSELDFDILLRQTSVPNLRVLTAGPLPPNPAELLGSARMGEILSMLQERADIVIIDSPPVTVVADTAVLSTKVNGTLIVLRAGKTRREMAKRTIEALHKVNARIAGIVLNGTSKRTGSYQQNYGYNYGYNYNYNLSRKKDGRKLDAHSPNVSRPASKRSSSSLLTMSKPSVTAPPNSVKSASVPQNGHPDTEVNAPERIAPELRLSANNGHVPNGHKRRFALITNSNMAQQINDRNGINIEPDDIADSE